MTRPWTTLAIEALDDADLELRQRGEDFLILYDGRVLMNSFSHGSEDALSRLTLQPILDRPAPRVLIGGLGMGFTLRAALDVLPANAQIVVDELNPVVVAWCEGPLGAATDHAIRDPRVRIDIADVSASIASAEPGTLDAILLDLYEGPNEDTQGRRDPFYSAPALARTHAALAPGGMFGVWSEASDAPFAQRFAAAGFDVTARALDANHVVYVGQRR